MSTVNKYAVMSAAAGMVIDLRKDGATGDYNPVGFLKLQPIKGGTPSSFLVKPVVVQNGDAAPSAPAVSPNPAAGSSTDWILLLSDSGYEPTIGIPFAKGYQQDIYGPPVATHLLVWCIAAGSFNVIGQ